MTEVKKIKEGWTHIVKVDTFFSVPLSKDSGEKLCRQL